jgi:cytidylate kinase
MIIAIDGPSAAGKGTLARGLAKHFGLHFLDTGALYRMVGLSVLRGQGDAVSAARTLNPAEFADADLRNEEVAKEASKAASIPAVRQALLEFQQAFAKRAPGAVLDGRDIGTVICPEADFKFFVTASVQARAERRFKELKNSGVSLEDITADVKARDERDAKQSEPAEDAIFIDTSELSAEECLAEVIKIIDGGK